MGLYRIKKTVKLWGIIGALFVIMITGCENSSTGENTTRVDLKSIWNVGTSGSAIIVDGEYVGNAFVYNEVTYIESRVVYDHINNKFYYDKKNNQIILTKPDEIIYLKVDDSDGTVIKSGENIYINIDYLKENTAMEYEGYNDPDRINIITQLGNIEYVTAITDGYLRQISSSDSDIMTDVKKGDELIVVSQNDEYYQVINDSGIKGFIRTKEVGDVNYKDRESSYKEVYSSVKLDGKVCLGWHQMEYYEGNDSFWDMTNGTTGMNVISPTWFRLANENGDIDSLASYSYVNNAHSMDLQVWALINDFSYGEDGVYYISTLIGDRDSRNNLIENLINEVKEYDIDGINIDFEHISLENGPDYIQFIRELSVLCRANNIVLSVDMYVPMSYNEYYGRKEVGEVVDYLIVMGYDEHWSGSDTAGSVASLPYVEAGINDTILVVDPDKVINAIPFYTRIWIETPEELAEPGDTIIYDSIIGNYSLGSSAVGMENAINALKDHGVEPYWVADLSQYYGEYEEGGITYRIWLEEEDSISAKINAMEEAGIGGIACWKLGLEKPEIWALLNSYVID